MRLRLHPAALVELDEAVAYLEEERPGFGALLFEEVGRRIVQASRFPKSGAPVVGLAEQYDVRQFVTRRFRFVVVTAVVADERLVLAIAHTSMEPRYWRERLNPPSG